MSLVNSRDSEINVYDNNRLTKWYASIDNKINQHEK